MNLMTLQRYRNEIILFVAFLLALFAFIYKLSAATYVKENQIKIEKQINEVTTIINLKKQWNRKDIANKVKTLKTIVAPSKVKSFKKKSKKLTAIYQELTPNELNKLTNKLINLPVQISHLHIAQSGKNQYTMEFTCKW